LIERKEIEFEGAEGNRLAGDVWGESGHPVIFLHGGGQTRRAWDATAERVAANGMRAITVDQRGHGESEWVRSGHYSFADFSEDVEAIVRQVENLYHARPSAVGASLGGLSCLVAVTRHPSLLESLILVDVTPKMDPEGVAKVRGFMAERMEEGFASLEEASEAIARYLPHRKRPNSLDGLRKNLRLDADGRYRWHWDPAMMRENRGLSAEGRGLMEEVMANLPNLHLPVLLVRGMQSELVHEVHAREFVDLAPSAAYVDVGGAGHMVAGDRNDVFCSAILDFLTDRRAA